MGGKSGGSQGPTLAQMEQHDDELRQAWQEDFLMQENARKQDEADQRAQAEQTRRDDLWKTAASDYDKVYANYKKQYDINSELNSRQGNDTFSGENVLKGTSNNEWEKAPEQVKFNYTGKQEELDAINKEMDRLQGTDFKTTTKNVGKAVRGGTMKKFQKKSGKSIQGMTSTTDDEEKLAKTLGA